MRVPLKWLRDYVDPGIAPEALAHKLTMAGLEVGKLERAGGEWNGIVIGQVLAIQPHPAADRLRLATVDLKEKQVTVVCGAPNLEVGQKVAFAGVGAQVADPETGRTFTLKAARIRGVVSEGMICSEKELCISDDRDGIMVLSPEAPTGAALRDYLGDVILDIEVTPNRPDCLSVTGIAREAAALTGKPISMPAPVLTAEAAAQPTPIAILDPALCPRYCAALITGVKVGPSPVWMQQRLIQCGMRPINNIVDITNYVMLEYGQPLHAFDFQKLRGGRIAVRPAREGEKLATLDGTERALTAETLVIADADSPVAIAGVMGGATSEVTSETSTILLESASFNSTSIRRTAARLNLRTEASTRFERGLSAGLPLPAAQRAAALLCELAGGRLSGIIADVYPGRKPVEPIPFGAGDAKRVLGLDMEAAQIGQALSALGFKCQPGRTPDELLVTVPYWRSDIRLKADLAEEVARVLGYDRVPTVTLSGEVPHQSPQPVLRMKERLKDLMVGCGFYEALTYSMVSAASMRKLAPDSAETPPSEPQALRLANPMSPEQEYLRTSLRPGLLAALAANQRFEKGGIRLFEVGKVYLPRPDGLPQEREMLCAVLSGRRSGPGRWTEGDGNMDFFDLKAVAGAVLTGLGVGRSEFRLAPDATLQPASSAELCIEGATVGTLGEVERRVATSFEVSGQAYLLELDIEKLLPFTARLKKFAPLSRFPGMARDIAIEVDRGVPAGKVQDIIASFPLVSGVAVFDCYTGKGVSPDKKSLAFNILYLSPERTLTEEEVNAVQDRILARLAQEVGAKLRGAQANPNV